jgi:predicted XRE-type DNA-binding protein
MNERPDTERIKAQLAADVVRVIDEQKLTDEEACARLGLTRKELADIRRGELASVDSAIELLSRLHQTVSVSVGPAPKTETRRRPIWERIAEIAAEIPPEELERLPTDLAANHDHYLYGTPKR